MKSVMFLVMLVILSVHFGPEVNAMTTSEWIANKIWPHIYDPQRTLMNLKGLCVRMCEDKKP